MQYKDLVEGKFLSTHLPSGKPNPNHPAFAKHDAEYKAKIEAEKVPRAKAMHPSEKVTMSDFHQVSGGAPDQDSFDAINAVARKHRIEWSHAKKGLDKHARTMGYRNIDHHLKDVYSYANESVNESAEQAPVAPSLPVHRIAVHTLEHPDDAGKPTKRMVRITGGDKEQALKSARSHFRRKGFHIHSAEYDGRMYEEVNESAELHNDIVHHTDKHISKYIKLGGADQLGSRLHTVGKTLAKKHGIPEKDAHNHVNNYLDKRLKDAGIDEGTKPMTLTFKQFNEAKAAHPDEVEDKKLVKKMVKKDCLVDEEVELEEMDNRTPSSDRREQRNYSPEAMEHRKKELNASLKKVSPEMRKKLSLPDVKEEVEQIEELSKKTLGSYVKKAVNSKSEKELKASQAGYNDEGDKYHADASKRGAGIRRAVDKMTEEFEIDEARNTEVKWKKKTASEQKYDHYNHHSEDGKWGITAAHNTGYQIYRKDAPKSFTYTGETHHKTITGAKAEVDKMHKAEKGMNENSPFDWKNKKSEIDWSKKSGEVKYTDSGLVHKAREGSRNAETGGDAEKKAVGRPKGEYGSYKIDKAKRDDPEYKKALSAKVIAAKKDGLEARKEYKDAMHSAIKKRQLELAGLKEANQTDESISSDLKKPGPVKVSKGDGKTVPLDWDEPSTKVYMKTIMDKRNERAADLDKKNAKVFAANTK
jgi:hypothetical protein